MHVNAYMRLFIHRPGQLNTEPKNVVPDRGFSCHRFSKCDAHISDRYEVRSLSQTKTALRKPPEDTTSEAYCKYRAARNDHMESTVVTSLHGVGYHLTSPRIAGTFQDHLEDLPHLPIRYSKLVAPAPKTGNALHFPKKKPINHGY